MFSLRFLLLIFVCLSGNIAGAQGFLKADGQKIVNGNGENVLLRGVGLGGWMLQEGYMLGLKWGGQQYVIRQKLEGILSKQQVQEFYDVWLSNHTTKGDIDSLKAWGFNSVRLPMHFELFTLAADKEPLAGTNTWLSKGFQLTDSLLAWCKANNMYLILDLHAAPGGQGNDLNISDRDPSKPTLWETEANQQKTIALWKMLAERYADETYIGGYDLLNETNIGFEDPGDKTGGREKKNEPLKNLLVAITKAIRTVDKNHLIIIEGNGYGNNYNGIVNEGLWDNNMALSFHKYWNYNDTKSIEQIISYRNKLNVPVWLGESGENSNVWFTQAISLVEANNIGWAWWPLKKLGANNPLQIKSNHNYDQLLAYLNGVSAEAPGESDAYSGLLEMAVYTNIRTNIVHYDVIDAMMRQPHDAAAIPFKMHKINNETTIQAADYDLGPNRVAYYDNDTADYWVSGIRDTGNLGGVYRNDGVDIYKDSTAYDGYFVGHIEDGEWLRYTIDVSTAGQYNLVMQVYATSGTGEIVVSANNVEKIAARISDAYGSAHWKLLTVKSFNLHAGTNTLKVFFKKGGFDFKALTFKK